MFNFDSAIETDFPPIVVTQVDLAEGLICLEREFAFQNSLDDAGRRSLVLVRVHGTPLGLIGLSLRTTNAQEEWTSVINHQFGNEIDAHLKADGIAIHRRAALWNGFPIVNPRCRQHRRVDANQARPISVIIATHERPLALSRCLDAMSKVDYPNFDVIVVDNAPLTNETFELVTTREETLQYVREDEKGLASAHNRGLQLARGEIVAFTDDDVEVDSGWLTEIMLGFAQNGDIASVTGLVLPASLGTPAQLALESHGRFSKGFKPIVVSRRMENPPNRLFPFAPAQFGSGANMAFETEYLRKLGGFDPALGTGTIARGGDDLHAIFNVLASGRSLAYQPTAIVWHHHHRELAALPRQARGYGIGFGAFFASIVAQNPMRIAELLKRLPSALLHLIRRRERVKVGQLDIATIVGADPIWTKSLRRMQFRGFLLGPFAYSRSRMAHARFKSQRGRE